MIKLLGENSSKSYVIAEDGAQLFARRGDLHKKKPCKHAIAVDSQNNLNFVNQPNLTISLYSQFSLSQK